MLSDDEAREVEDFARFFAEENLETNFYQDTLESLGSRPLDSLDPLEILSNPLAAGALICEDPESKKQRRIIESKAADILADHLRGRLAWDAEAGVWFLWTGTHWQPQDNGGRAESLIAASVHSGCAEVGYRPAYLAGTTTLIQRRGLLAPPAFGSGRIPFRNGLLDIATMKLEAHAPRRSLAWCLPHDYHPEATCPTIHAWLLRNVNGDGETVEMLRAWLACLLRGKPLQKFLLLLGRGGTGKGTFQRLCTAMIGASNVAISSLRDLENNRFETAKLFGKRLAMVNEAGRHGGAVNVLKAITGGDHISLERKHVQQNGGFVFGGLVMMASNEDLLTTDQTSGLERRRITVAFPVTATPQERADWEDKGGEEAVLHPEIPGLINWCLALSEAEIRQRIENPPQRVHRANLLGLAAGNSVAEWLMERCAPAPGEYAQVGVRKEIRSHVEGVTYFDNEKDWLYANYLAFCQEQGRLHPLALRRFADTIVDIAEHLGWQVRRAEHPVNRSRCILGLKFREDSPFTESI